jgi:flagellar protein FliO/FliZ
MDTPAAELPGLGSSLALSFISLGLVCLLAYGLLRWLGRRGVGQGAGPIRVVGRCPLEPRRTLFLVETAGRCFLIGAAEGALSLIAEVDAAQARVVERQAPSPGARFPDTLRRILRQGLGRPPGHREKEQLVKVARAPGEGEEGRL